MNTQHSLNLKGGEQKNNSQKQKNNPLSHSVYTISHFKQIPLNKMHPSLNSHKGLKISEHI